MATIIGTAGKDTLVGTNLVDTINGGAGDDIIDGGAGDDKMAGDTGNDTFLGGAGADSMDGGAGVDTVTYAASTAGVKVLLGTGRGYGGQAEGDTLTSIENVTGSQLETFLVAPMGAITSTVARVMTRSMVVAEMTSSSAAWAMTS
jgi:Ca2+-binding RTX toxin-like protein